MSIAVHEAAARALDAQRDFLWGFCYRMTGGAVDADALVQETFVRALERPPVDLVGGWHPCLARFAASLSIDALRMRQRRDYVGPWLPAPIETGSAADESDASAAPREGVTYSEVESLSIAFLIALEALTPRQRAVLILRSVFGYSVQQTAHALDLTFLRVRATLQKALPMMAEYNRRQVRPTRETQTRVASLLREFLHHLQYLNRSGIEAMLAPDARALSDSGGEFVAPIVPVVKRDKIVRQLMKLAEKSGPPTRYAFRMLNALPALVAEVPAPAVWAQRFVFRIEINAEGRISELHTILATPKLAAVSFEP